MWGKDRLSVRKIYGLIANLGPDTATVRNVTKGWGNTEELLATLIEVVDVGNIQNLAANGVKQSGLPKPIQINRPDQLERQRRKATNQEIGQIFKEGLRLVSKEEVSD